MSDEMNISEMMAHQVNRLFADAVSRDSWVAGEQGQFDTALWQSLVAMGIPLAMCSESTGGAEMSWRDMEQTLRLCGRYAAPIPLGESVIASGLLDRAGIAVPDGPMTFSAERFELDAQGRVHGVDQQLSWSPAVRHVVLLAGTVEQPSLCLVSIDSERATATPTYDRMPAGALKLNGEPVTLSRSVPWLKGADLRPYLAALRAIQMAGAMEQVLDLCLEYAGTRIQFGKTLGKFQAIQQYVAELAEHTAAAQVAGLYAARQIDADRAEYGAAIAKSLTGRAATRMTEIAHQIFGAIGVTDEHSLHYFTRRLWQWRAEGGSEHYWAEYLGRNTLAAEGATLWQRVTRPLD